MIRFFKSPQPATLFIIPIIVLVLWASRLSFFVPVADHTGLPLWAMIASIFSSLPSWLNYIFLAALVSSQAVYFNILLNKHEVLYKNSYLPALIFALLISSNVHFLEFHPVHFVNLIAMRVFDRLFSLYKNESPVSPLFDSAFLAGTAALIYLPALILFPVLILSISILRPFSLREWLIIIISFFLPFFFTAVILFWQRDLVSVVSAYMNQFRQMQFHLINERSLPLFSLAIYCLFLLLISLLKLRLNFYKNVIRTRNFQQVFFFFLILALVAIAIVQPVRVINFAFLAIPMSLLIGYYFMSAKKRMWMYEFSLWLLIAFVVWNHVV
jgi:hypothetical protein